MCEGAFSDYVIYIFQIQFSVYTRLSSVFSVLYVMILGMLFGVFSQFSFGRKLLEMVNHLSSFLLRGLSLLMIMCLMLIIVVFLLINMLYHII